MNEEKQQTSRITLDLVFCCYLSIESTLRSPNFLNVDTTEYKLKGTVVCSQENGWLG